MSSRGSLAIVGLQPQRILPLGRYVLDADGRLHAWRHRGFIKAVAVVTIRHMAKKPKIPAGGSTTADAGGGCEGSAPEGTSGALARVGIHAPANADQRHTPRPAAELQPRLMPTPLGPRICLAEVTSEMDRRAARAVKTRTDQVREEIAELRRELKVLCRCGGSAPGATNSLVPSWFGRDCIESECPLKVPA